MTPVTHATNWADRPSWTADGLKISYDSMPNIIGARQPTLMNVDGSNKVRIPNLVDDDSGVVWSPDGSWMAFIRNSPTYQESSIIVAAADGTGQRVIYGPVGYSLASPSWSPDSKRLVFQDNDVLIIKADGTGLTVLSPASSGDGWPVWSR